MSQVLRHTQERGQEEEKILPDRLNQDLLIHVHPEAQNATRCGHRGIADVIKFR